VAVFLLCFGLTGAAQGQDPSAFEGRRITQVIFDPPQQPLQAAEIDRILPVKAGQMYTSASIRTAIERLYATGRYQDIQVDATGADGVQVTFLTKNSWFVGKVSASGDIADPPNAGQIVNASRLQLGGPFDPAQIPAAVGNIRKLLVENGYFEPKIDPQLQYDDTYQQVHVTFAIVTGQRAHYEPPGISFGGSGDTSILTAEAITNASRWHRFLLPGYHGITENRTRKGIDSIRLKYQNSNRILATVVLNGIDPEEDGKNGKPEITVTPGPIVTVTHPAQRSPKGNCARTFLSSKNTRLTTICSTKGRTIFAIIFSRRGIPTSTSNSASKR
jgi:outer membrane protein assembly factor BamA